MPDRLISVVLPTRNRVELLPRAIATVLAQEGPSAEVIVVDDASTDGTHRVAAQLAQEHHGVRVLSLAAPAGAAAARNRGVAAARGEWIALLDDDDEWLPGKLVRQLDAAGGDSRIGLVHGDFEEVMPDGTRIRASGVSAEADRMRRLLVRGNRLGHSTVMVRRELLLECGGYDEELPRLQDWDLWLRLAGRTRFGHVPELLARVHRGPRTISADASRLLAASRLLVVKHVGRPGPAGLKPSEQADLILTLGRLLTASGAQDAAAPFLARAAVHRPWSPRRALAAISLRFAPDLFSRVERLLARLSGARQ